MKIGRQFNTLTPKEYFFFIDNHKKYTDFNTLGLYRSLDENKRLTTDEKIAVREYANLSFKKSFDFLQIKDPQTYFDVITLGQELTKGDTAKIWDEIKAYQQKTLTRKRSGHRNFGVYSKHSCGRDNCHLDEVMIKRGSYISYGEIYFSSDKSRIEAKNKSHIRRQERKNAQQVIRRTLNEE